MPQGQTCGICRQAGHNARTCESNSAPSRVDRHVAQMLPPPRTHQLPFPGGDVRAHQFPAPLVPRTHQLPAHVFFPGGDMRPAHQLPAPVVPGGRPAFAVPPVRERQCFPPLAVSPLRAPGGGDGSVSALLSGMAGLRVSGASGGGGWACCYAVCGSCTASYT